MSRVFEHFLDDLGQKSGYGYDFVAVMWNTVNEECEEDGVEFNLDSFIATTLERDW